MFLLVLIFILVPIAELYVIIKVGEAIGLVPTLVLLLADAVLGSMLLRQQGRMAWMRFNRALAENRLPHKEVLDGVLVIFGGALLLTPGFITDVLGLVLLIPPTRAMVRGISSRVLFHRLRLGRRTVLWGAGQVRDRQRRRTEAPPSGQPPPFADPDFGWEDSAVGRPSATPRQDDIEGTGQEIRDEDELPRGRG